MQGSIGRATPRDRGRKEGLIRVYALYVTCPFSRELLLNSASW